MYVWPWKPEVSALGVARHFAQALGDGNEKHLTKCQHQEEGKPALGHLTALQPHLVYQMMWAEADLNSEAVLVQLLAQLVPKLQDSLGVSDLPVALPQKLVSEAAYFASLRHPVLGLLVLLP